MNWPAQHQRRKWQQNVCTMLALLACFIGFSAAAASTVAPAESFEEANRLYDQAKFPEAAQAYQKLAESGASTPAVLFNMANALFKSGQIGRAVAVYRMVQLRTPRDPDLQANLNFALGRVQGPRATESLAARWLKNFTLNEWALAASAGFWVLLLLIAARQIPGWKTKIGVVWLASFGIITLLLAGCLAAAIYSVNARPKAIVVVPEAQVRKGPLEEETNILFRVQDGAELKILDRYNDWLLIGVDGGRQGWIKRSEVAARN